MIRAALVLPLLAGLLHCTGDETLSGYGAQGVTWRLQEMDGAPYPAKATLTFPEEGRIAGEAPCNSFSGAQTVPYPWFRAEQVAATRRACPELEAEAAFFRALSEMTLAEVAGDTLILKTEDGREMVFRAVE